MTHPALASGPYMPAGPGGFVALGRLIGRLWRRWAGRRELSRLNDRMLADIGLSRGRVRRSVSTMLVRRV
jgi:uncharacterized protein YjiS (DUF1127 family)